ncbi:hypothetical protein FE257_008486 [Aspergillus nanangensis]|uniref:Uncharacterized protein n=1 Tax=Aspergillus nanangensis TaxID=2582783 RepID=A0AAD4CL63_ASPNN|nr:hypothetical protein FE257_008486 [Aspergillus nanangensis]
MKMKTSLDENSSQDAAVSGVDLEPHLTSSTVSDLQETSTVTSGSNQSEFALNFSPDYVRDWTTTSAFRNYTRIAASILTRNRKDAIIESFQLDPRSFRPVYEESEQHICITVSKGARSEALGFIRHDKSTGQVTLANACATLEPEALQLGKTTKRGKDQLVGCHGEGLKLAAMLMSREGYRVSVETNNTHWDFCLQDSSQFRCTVSSSERAIPKRRPNPRRDMARFMSRIWRDVTVIIQPRHNPCRQEVSHEQFRKWLEVSMEIRGYSYPESVIETDCGDLILDPRYRGKMFLKGLLLPSSISEPRELKLGYNFVEGDVNRDRQWLVNRQQEADLLRKIWESAIHKNRDLILPIYVNILWNFPRAPDVELAEDLLERPTRLLIWKHLLRIADGRRFYFCQKTGSLSVGTITGILKKEPVGLPDTLWHLLEGSVPIRTADQQRVHMFRHATVAPSPMTLFGTTVLRALRASLVLCSYPSKIEIVDSDSKIQLLVDIERQAIIIDQQSFDISKVHERVCRPRASLIANEAFLCDHVIEELFAVAQC